MTELICEECGDDLAAEGYIWCTECMEALFPPNPEATAPDNFPSQ